MSWTAVETTKSEPATSGRDYYRVGKSGDKHQANGTIALTVWRCSGCRRYACTKVDESPGPCGKCRGT